MPTPFAMIRMALSQTIGPQRLLRAPEPEPLTDAPENVLDYDQVMTTKLAVAYAGALEFLHRVRPEPAGGEAAIDLACGPGHFTLCLARHLGCEAVTGVDLAPRMVRAALANAEEQGLADRVSFRSGDVTDLAGFSDDEFHLSSFTGAAHHLPGIRGVRETLAGMDRVTRPEGVVFAMDLVRLRTRRLTDRYVRTLGHDYLDRGLGHFYEDFRNSMFAAYTPREFAAAVPEATARRWVHVVPRMLPTIQILVGLPVGRKGLYRRPGYRTDGHPFLSDWGERWVRQVGADWSRETLRDCSMFRLGLRTARRRVLRRGT